MSKKIFAITLISFLVSPVVALAQPPETMTEIITGGGDIITLIDTVANWIFAILLAVALIFILLAAFQFLTSGGDPAKVTSARQSLVFALVGVAVAFLAKGLVAVVRFILTG